MHPFQIRIYFPVWYLHFWLLVKLILIHCVRLTRYLVFSMLNVTDESRDILFSLFFDGFDDLSNRRQCFCYFTRIMIPLAFLRQFICEIADCWHSYHVGMNKHSSGASKMCELWEWVELACAVRNVLKDKWSLEYDIRYDDR